MSHATIISQAGVTAIANMLGVSKHTVNSWRTRNSIPAWHWAALQRAGVATLNDLAEPRAHNRTSHGRAAPGAGAA